MISMGMMKKLLVAAISKKRVPVVKEIIPHINLEEPIIDRDSALHIAVKCKAASEIYEILIKAGAPLEAKEKKGLTPLECAFILGNVEGIIILIKAGAKYDGKFPDGETFLDRFESKYPDKLPEVMKVINDREHAEAAPQQVHAENPIIGYMYGLAQSVGLSARGGYRRLPAEEPPNHKKNK